MPDLYEVDVEPNKMLGMCNWFRNGKPINGIYVPAQVLREINEQLDAEQKKPTFNPRICDAPNNSSTTSSSERRVLSKPVW